MAPAPLLEVDDLRTYFDTDEGTVKAVDGVSFSVRRGQTLGIVGESGCGKSITAFTILRLIPSPPGRIVAGSIRFSKEENGSSPIDLAQLHPRGREIRQIRGNEIAMIFQEPMTSLSPVHTIGNQISEAVRLHQQTNRAEAKTRSIEALRRVRLPRPDRQYDAFPHDLSVVEHISDRVAVMYLGKIVETASASTLYTNPTHPYTAALLSAVPVADPKRQPNLIALGGDVPDPAEIPPGCRFHTRCPFAEEICRKEEPPNRSVAHGHWSACHVAGELDFPQVDRIERYLAEDQ